MKKILMIALFCLVFVSCADSKKLNIDGKDVIVEPYGWFDSSAKNDSVNYKVNVGNIVLSVIFSENDSGSNYINWN
jgi:hypothetical protein